MVAFDVRVNGKRLCKAGTAADFGVMTVILHWARRREQPSDASRRQRSRIIEELGLEVGGLDSSGPHSGEHSKWITRALRRGDRLSVTIADAKRVDAPKRRYRLEPRSG